MSEKNKSSVSQIPMPINPEGALYPRLWLGTWSMSGEGFGPHSLALSLETLKKAYESGIRHYDTAGFYGKGRSEELLKKAFRGVRKNVFIATKGGLLREGRRVWHDASGPALRRALYESLERLGTDYVDLYQLHWPDPAVSLDESLGALEELRKEGLARFVGICNFTLSQIEKYVKKGSRIFHQIHFNLIHQETLSVLRSGKECERCINCVTSPLEQGLLASISHLEMKLGKKDVRRRNPWFQNGPVKKRLFLYHELCRKAGVNPAGAAIRWLLRRRDVDVVIPGPKTPLQLMQIMESFSQVYPDRLFDSLDRFSYDLSNLYARAQ